MKLRLNSYICKCKKVLLWILSISISIRRFFNIRLDATRNIIDMNVPDCVVPVCILNNYCVSQQKCILLARIWSQMSIYQNSISRTKAYLILCPWWFNGNGCFWQSFEYKVRQLIECSEIFLRIINEWYLARYIWKNILGAIISE